MSEHTTLGPLPAGLLTVESGPGIAYAGGMRRYEPIQALPDGEHKLYTQSALDAVVSAERERCAKIARKYGRADGSSAQQIAAEILGIDA